MKKGTSTLLLLAGAGVLAYFFLSNRDGTGAGGTGSGGGSSWDIIPGSNPNAAEGGAGATQERPSSGVGGGAPVFGPGGNLPGAFGITALVGSTGGQREQYFLQQAASGNLWSTTGSIYESKKMDTIAKYSLGGDTPVLALGAAGAVQDLTRGGTINTTSTGGWEYVVNGQVQAGGSAGSLASAYGTPFMTKKEVVSTSLGTLEGSGIVSRTSQGLVRTAAGNLYRCSDASNLSTCQRA